MTDRRARLTAAIAGSLVALLTAFPQSTARADESPSAQAFYSAAVQAMRELPQPQFLTYTMNGEGDGLEIRLTVIRHLVWLEMGNSMPPVPSPPVTWRVRHRTDDYASEILDGDGTRYVSARAFFDPTWYGAFRALRDGMLFYQKDEQPISASATPTPGPSPDLRTIAVVSVIGTSIYRVVDKGPAQCPNGDDGHALNLISRERNPTHQLSDVTVDLRNMRFCSLRFNVSEPSGFRGSVEQHYGDVGGYWLQTDGFVETSVRTLGLMVGHGIWRYRLEDMTFPRRIPPEVFLRPPTQ